MSRLSRVTINVAGVSIQFDAPERAAIPSYTLHFDDERLQAGELIGIVTDESTGLMWSAEDVVPKACTQEKAEQACKDLRLGGFDDWRLPTRKELLTLVDDTRHSPAIDVERFPNCKSSWYWTCTPYAADPDYAWIVDFNNGHSSNGYRDYDYALARAVRSVAPGQ